MFGSSVRLRPDVLPVRGELLHSDCEALADSSRAQLGRYLDALGVGHWITEHSSGGCHTWALYLDNGTGDYIYVATPDGPLSPVCDADEFVGGLVSVGFHVDYDRGGDYEDCFEPVCFVDVIDWGADRERAIVDAVARVFVAVGFTADVDGIDWAKVAVAVIDGVCESCGDTGANSYGGPCWSCEAMTEAPKWAGVGA